MLIVNPLGNPHPALRNLQKVLKNMAFKKRETVPTTEASVVSQSKPNLKAEIESFSLVLESALTASMNIPDEDLPQSLRDGLTEVAKIIGLEYDPISTSTFFFAVRNDGEKYLYGPSLKAHGDSACIVWGQSVIELKEEELLSSDKFQIVPDQRPIVLIDVSGFAFPVSVSLSEPYKRQEDFNTRLLTLRTMGALAPYLNRGEPILKWSEVKDGEAIEFYEKYPVYDRNDETRVKYGLVLGTLQDQPVRFYLPGSWEEWADTPFSPDQPARVEKNGMTITCLDRHFELKGSFKKLADLEIGKKYKVVGHKAQDGQFGVQSVLSLIDGDSVFSVNGNTYCKQRLLGSNPPSISEDEPAELIVDSISVMKNGNKKVNCRLLTASDKANPLLAKLKAKAAENAKINAGEVAPAL
jgi:hypothetical protein